MERQLCRDAILPMPVICEVPCSKDCVLSPWTPWSLCSHTCSGKNTEGKQTRARSILAYNAGEGRNSRVLYQENKAGSGTLVESDPYGPLNQSLLFYRKILPLILKMSSTKICPHKPTINQSNTTVVLVVQLPVFTTYLICLFFLYLIYKYNVKVK